MTENKGKKLYETPRRGDISATVWENEHQGKKFQSISLSRSFVDLKAGERKWQTINMGEEDLQSIKLIIEDLENHFRTGKQE